MSYLGGATGGGALGLKEWDRQEQHDSRMQTEEVGRNTSRLSQLETMQGMRDKDYAHTKDVRGEGQRAASRTGAIAKARADTIQSQQEAEAMQDLDSVSRLSTAYRMGNTAMFDSTLETMNPGTREALMGVPMDRLPKMMEEMMGIATNNLEMVRKRKIIGATAAGQRSVAGEKGRQARMTGQQADSNALVRQEGADENANYRARVGAGAPGMIADQALDDPDAAKGKQDAYIESTIGALNRKGMPTAPTQAEQNAAIDKAVSTGVSAAAQSFVSDYSGEGVHNIRSEEDMAGIPGWATMRTVAGHLARERGFSGEQIQAFLTGQFIMLDNKRGFIRMPVDAMGEPAGKLTARTLLQDARDTGESIDQVIRRYGIYIKRNYPNVSWSPTL